MIRSNSNLASFLKLVHKQMMKNYDIFLVVDGSEGVGKSRGIVLNVVDYWYRKILNKKVPEWSINIDIKNWIKHLDNCSEGELVALDEAGDSLDSMKFANKFNRLLYQAYTIIREKISFSMVVLPSFFDLTPRFRKRRVRFLIHCYKRVDNRCNNCGEQFVGEKCSNCGSEDYRTGFLMYEIYDRPRINEILERNRYNKIKKVRCGVTPLVKGTVREYKGSFSDKYSQMKKDKMKSVLAKLKNSVGLSDDDSEVVKACNHSWLYRKSDKVWWCRKCGFETSTNPYKHNVVGWGVDEDGEGESDE